MPLIVVFVYLFYSVQTNKVFSRELRAHHILLRRIVYYVICTFCFFVRTKKILFKSESTAPRALTVTSERFLRQLTKGALNWNSSRNSFLYISCREMKIFFSFKEAEDRAKHVKYDVCTQLTF